MANPDNKLQHGTATDSVEKPVQSSRSIRAGIPIDLAFMVITATLVVITAGVILAIAQHSAITSIKELVREKAEIVSLTIVERVKNHLEPVVAQSVHMAQIVSDMAPEQATAETIGARLYAALAASPQISSLALVDRNHMLVRSFRNRPATKTDVSDWSDVTTFKAMLEPAWRSAEPYWGPLFYAESSDTTLLNFLAPVVIGAETEYVLISSVSLTDLTLFIESLQSEMTGQAFILYGDDGILAYSQLDGNPAKLSDRTPLPTLSSIEETPLAHIWSPDRLPRVEADLTNELEARVVKFEDESYVFLFRRLDGFGEEPWIVGSYFTLDGLAPQLGRSKAIIAVSLLVIFLGAIVALLLGRFVSQPIRRLATTAHRINEWQFDNEDRLPASVFREINEANTAFNSAIQALKSLQVYIPRRLARRLIDDDGGGEIASEEHDISILFTDIVDFTGQAERMSPEELVRFLNSHFSLMASCIDAENGVVDKFIGDSTMAFWGGLKSDEDHATHACRAAVRIAEALFHENGVRRANGLPPIRVRIGIHSGNAMVGNIGSPGRLNYTVIGDSVNTAQRLEMLSREVGEEDAEVVTLISGETALRLGSEFLISPVGRKVLHGRHVETDVFMLKSTRVSDTEETSSAKPRPL